jgi:hypothetical protein
LISVVNPALKKALNDSGQLVRIGTAVIGRAPSFRF